MYNIPKPKNDAATKYQLQDLKTTAQDNTSYYNRHKLAAENNAKTINKKRNDLGSGIKGINGNKKQATQVTEGCLYVFDAENNLKHCFVVTKGSYQEVKLTQSHFNYNTKIGKAQPCAKIADFFKGDNTSYKGYQFVYSPIKLTKDRLFNSSSFSVLPEFAPKDSARGVELSQYGLAGLNDDQRSGPSILLEYQTKDRPLPPAHTYHLKTTNYQGIGAGVVIHYPNPIEELKRRTEIFQNRFKNLENWINDDNRSGQFFIHQAIKGMLAKNSSMSWKVDQGRMDAWEKLYNKQYHEVHGAMVTGLINLIAWLRSPEFKQTVYNYATSTNKAHLVLITEAYAEACRFFNLSLHGKQFLEEELQNSSSFICLINGLNPNVKSSEDLFARYATLLRDDLMDQDAYNSLGMTGRKAEQAFVNILGNSSLTISKVFGYKALARIGKRLGKIITGINMPFLNVKILNSEKTMAEVLNKKAIEKLLNSKKLFATIALFELYNLTLAIKTYQNDPENKAKNLFGLVGASADIVSENYSWLLIEANKFVKSNTLSGLISSAVKITSPLVCISGLIDAMVGADSAISAHNRGELELRNAYITYSIGGALIAFGAAAMVAGGETAVLSLGVGSVPATVMVTSGIITSFIGLAFQYWWDDKALKDWLDDSIFGDHPKILKKDLLIFSEIDTNSKETYVKTLLNIEGGNNETKPHILAEIDAMNAIMFNYFIEGNIHQVEDGFKSRMKAPADPRLPALSAQQQALIKARQLPNKYTIVTVEIEPGLITPNAEITFSQLKKHSIRRVLESLDYSQKNDEKEYVAAVADVKIPLSQFDLQSATAPALQTYKNTRVKKDHKGRVVNINQSFIFAHEDIDKLTGKITIDFKRHSSQIITKDFSITV